MLLHLGWSRARLPVRAPKISKTFLRVELLIPGGFMVPDFLFLPCKILPGNQSMPLTPSKVLLARAQAGQGKGNPPSLPLDTSWEHSALPHPNNSRAGSAVRNWSVICLSLADHTEQGFLRLICIWLLESLGFLFLRGVTARVMETKGQMLWAGRVQLATALC